jgi:hypothetical protein
LQEEGKASWWNNYGETLLRDVLIRGISKERIEQFNPPIEEHKTARCQEYLNAVQARHFEEFQNSKKIKDARCTTAWRLFYSKAKSVFDRHPDAIAPESRNLKRDDPEF